MFHKYIYKHKLTLVADHYSLIDILGSNCIIPILTHSTLHRYAITLSAYNYNICYKEGSYIANADGLSMVPMEISKEIEIFVKKLYLFLEMREIPMPIEDVEKDIEKDQLLLKVKGMVRYKFFELSFELSVESKC